MKTRNEIYGGTFSSPEAPDTNANGELKKLVLSDSADITKNRSSWIRTIFYNIMDSFTHKTEDRATGSNIGVSGTGIESTQTVYTTPEQLPEVDKTTNDFSTPAKSDANGVLTTTNDLFSVTPTTTDRKNKKFVVNFSSAGVLFFKARTWLQSEIENLITDQVETIIIDSGIVGTRVGTITSTAHTTDDTASRNIIIDTRTIGKGSSGASLNDDKYETLWKHLYDKYPDAICTLNVSRTTRDADWIANRTLTLPKIYGRVLVGKDGTQTEFDTIGETGGAKTHTLIEAEIPELPGIPPATGDNDRGSSSSNWNLDGEPVVFGGGQPHNNLQPYVVLNNQITY
jgi:hypothetical protein